MAMMSGYINVENWVADQVAAWLRGLDDVVLPYVHFFLNNGINGKKLLMLTHQDLEDFGITKLGHQELILEAVDLLRALHYGFETENLQSVTLHLGCKAKSLHNDLQATGVENDMNNGNVSYTGQSNHQRLPVSVLSSVADILTALKVVVSWLDRAPFESMYEMCLQRNTIVKIGIDLIAVTQKDHPRQEAEDAIMKSCSIMSDICDEIVIQSRDPLVIQPTSLELATIRKKPGEELGMHIQSSYYGIHAIGGVKDLSPAFLCGKIEKGDEVIAVNHQIVVGWQLKKLVNTLKEKPKEVVLLLKKRPHHINPFGNVPNKKKLTQKQQAATLPSITKRRSREGDKQPRPSLQEFVSVTPPAEEVGFSPKDGNDTDNEVFRSGSESPKFKLEIEAKPRRATVSGGSPTLERPALIIEDLDAEGHEASAFSSPDSAEEDLRPSATYTHTLEVPESPLLSASQRRQEYYSSKSDSDVLSPEQKRQDYRLTRTESQKSHKIERPLPVVATPPTQQVLSTPTPVTLSSVLATPTPVLATPTPVLATPTPVLATPQPVFTTQVSCQTVSSPVPASPAPSDAMLALDKALPPSAVNPVSPTLIPLATPTNADKHKSRGEQEVAGAPSRKSQPKLMKIRKLDSNRLIDKADKESEESEENTDTERLEAGDIPPLTKKDSTSSYTVTIVGGVIQKMPTQAGVVQEKTVQPESPVPVMRRQNRPAKRMDRRVSCKDLGKGDCEGWLYKRKKMGSLLSSKWHKRWFVLKNYNLYYYKHQEDLRAEGVIHLPSFKVSPDATDIKGIIGMRKMHAFKVYNTGTAFYFASDRQEDMTKWMNKMGLAAIVYAPKDSVGGFYRPDTSTPAAPRRQHPIAEDADYSESDEESERESSPGKLSPSSSVRSLSSGSSSVGSPASHPASPERVLPTHLDSSPELTPAETASSPVKGVAGRGYR
ncbi:connector enhancer of kinase suppressor of ras 2-like isoform X2 [Liolophura sinensis]|uniref:connector enhancer of kinase suppressor of ras 2-like isoform X2 n=1 Tax=Liolophura sinensis TaxID=3198878 RepID=UPI003158BF49